MDFDGVELRDVTDIDPYALAAEWGEDVTATRSGLCALLVKHPVKLRQHAGPHYEEGVPGDVLLVHNQKMRRHIISHSLFEFLFGETLT